MEFKLSVEFEMQMLVYTCVSLQNVLTHYGKNEAMLTKVSSLLFSFLRDVTIFQPTF